MRSNKSDNKDTTIKRGKKAGTGQYKQHDALVKELLLNREMAIGFLNSYLPAEVFERLDLSSLQLKPTEFIKDGKARYGDFLFSAKYRIEDKRERVEKEDEQADSTQSGKAEHVEVNIYMLIEHKSRDDRFVLLQLLQYMVCIWTRELQKNPNLETLTPIIPMIIYQTPQGYRHPLNFKKLIGHSEDKALEVFMPSFQASLCDMLPAVKDLQVVQSVNDVMNLFLALGRQIGGFEGLSGLDKIFGYTATWGMNNPDKLQRLSELLPWLIRYAVSTNKELGECEAEDIDALLIKNNLMEDYMRTWIDDYIEKGVEKGKLIGILEGRQQNARATLLKQMRKKYKLVPSELENRVLSSDLADIERWLDEILEANLLSDLFPDYKG